MMHQQGWCYDTILLAFLFYWMGANDHSGGLATQTLNPPGPRGGQIWIQIWQYIPIYPAIIPICALVSDTLGVLDLTYLGGSPRTPYAQIL